MRGGELLAQTLNHSPGYQTRERGAWWTKLPLHCQAYRLWPCWVSCYFGEIDFRLEIVIKSVHCGYAWVYRPRSCLTIILRDRLRHMVPRMSIVRNGDSAALWRSNGLAGTKPGPFNRKIKRTRGKWWLQRPFDIAPDTRTRDAPKNRRSLKASVFLSFKTMRNTQTIFY